MEILLDILQLIMQDTGLLVLLVSYIFFFLVVRVIALTKKPEGVAITKESSR